MSTLTIQKRIEKLEASRPKFGSLDHLSNEELAEQIVRLKAESAKSDCPNCEGCISPRECRDLHDENLRLDAELAAIRS